MSAENRFIKGNLSAAAYIRGHETMVQEASTNKFYPFGPDYISPGDLLSQDVTEAPKCKIIKKLV